MRPQDPQQLTVCRGAKSRRLCAKSDRRLLPASKFAVRPVRGRLAESRVEPRTEEKTPELTFGTNGFQPESSPTMLTSSKQSWPMHSSEQSAIWHL
jgi:hypothetical protein